MYNVKKENYYRLPDKYHPVGIGIRENAIVIELEGDGLNWEQGLDWAEWERIVAWVEWRFKELETSSSQYTTVKSGSLTRRPLLGNTLGQSLYPNHMGLSSIPPS